MPKLPNLGKRSDGARQMISTLTGKLNASWFNKPHQSLSFDQKWHRIILALAPLGRVSRGNTVEVFRDSGDAFASMWSAVDAATHTVKWQTYICKDDAVGVNTMSKLQAAHERGVVTELLYDCGGNISGRERLTSRLRELGATVIRHRPFLSQLWPYFRSGGVWELSPGIRNHRKILIVDGKTAFTGGLNIGDDYCAASCGGNGRFRDTQCRIEGPAVAHLHEVYEDTKHPVTWHLRFARWRQVLSAAASRGRGRLSLKASSVKAAQQQPQDATKPPILQCMQQLRTNRRKQREAAKRVALDETDEYANGQQQQRPHGRSPRAAVERVMRLRQAAAARAASNMKLVLQRAKDAGGHRRSALLRRYARAVQWSKAALREQRTQRPQRSLGARGVRDCEPIPEAVALFHEHQLHEGETGGSAPAMAAAATASAPAGTGLRPADGPSMPLEQPVHANPSTPSLSFVQILMSNPHTKDWSIQLAMWQVTRLVHRRLWITTPYYMPYRKLTAALIQSAHRGVDIRIVAGSHRTTDPWFMWYASRYLTRRLLKAGVRVFEFDGGQIMHAKTVVADSVWSSVGSYNWDMMSNKNMEVCATAFDMGAARQVEAQFLMDAALAQEVTLEDLDREWWWCWRVVSFGFYQALRFLEYFTFRTYRDSELDSRVD